MLPAKYRLPGRDIPVLVKSGRYSSHSFQQNLLFATHHLPNQYNHPRVAIIVSKKHVNQASERNRIKRKLRAAAWEAIRSNLDIGVDIVILGKSDQIATADFDWTISSISRLLSD